MFILLFLLWVILNGRLDAEIAVFGILIASAVCIFMNRIMHYSFIREIKAVSIIPQALSYFLLLIWEIIKANINVFMITLNKNKKVSPAVCHFKTGLKSNLARVILANSITLTPGTITVSLHDDEFWIHCLDKSMADGIEDSVFSRRLEKMEKRLAGREEKA